MVKLLLYIALNRDPLRPEGTEEEESMSHQMTLFWHTHVSLLSLPCYST